MLTHHVECDTYIDRIEDHLHKEGCVDFKQLLLRVAQEGYLPGKNLDICKDKLIFHLDNGNRMTLQIHTLQ